MATAAQMPDLTGLDKTQQLDALRRRMASVPGRRDHAPTDLPEADLAPIAQPSGTTSATADDDDREPDTVVPLSGAVRSQTLRTIPTPLPVAELLPRGALARGTAVSVTGAGSVLVGIVAAASAAGHHVAIVGLPKFGLLAAYEQGADLSKISLVEPPDPETALDAASICLDGVDVVITTLGGRDVPPTRARALLARCRSHASVLICADGRMPGVDLTIASAPVACDGIGQGRGRLRSITVETSVRGRGTPQRTGRYTLAVAPFSGGGPTWAPAPADRQRSRTPLAAAQ